MVGPVPFSHVDRFLRRPDYSCIACCNQSVLFAQLHQIIKIAAFTECGAVNVDNTELRYGAYCKRARWTIMK